MGKSINVKFVKLSDINPAINRTVRKDSQEFKDFVDNIEKMGVLSPIMLAKNPAGPEQWKIVFGGHRYTACKMLNEAGKTCVSDPTNDFSTIPCILSDIDPDSVGFTQIVENLRTNKCSQTEYANQLLRLMAMPKYAHLSRADFSAELGLGKSPAWLNNVLSLNELLPEAQALVDAGKIKITAAYDLALLPAEEQLDYIERAQSMDTADFKKLVVDRKAELKRLAKGQAPGIPDPLADAKVRSKTEIKNRFIEIENRMTKPGLSENDLIKLQANYEGLAYALSLDPETRAAKDAEKKENERLRDELRRKRAELLAKMRSDAKEQAEIAVKGQMAGASAS